MKKFSDYSAYIEKAIRDLEYKGGELSGLYEPISYSMSAGGKRLRPSLTLMAAEAFGAAPEDAAMPAIGLEMFHNFTLLHDDVMDNSEVRRGRPSVYARWDRNTAILSGDTMLTIATQMVTDVPDASLRTVLATFNDMAIKVYEGQRLDMDFEKREDVTLEEYIRMIGDKTGALLGASASIGALIAGAEEKDAVAMYEFGYKLGLAFQIQDDWLDVYGDTTSFGKPIGGDINNNKKSFLLLTALATGGPEAVAIREAMKFPAGQAKVTTVTRLYDKMKISEKCRAAVNSYSRDAMAALRSTSLSEEAREPFRLIVEKLTGRKK